MNAVANDDTFKSDNFKASPNQAFGSSFNDDEENEVPF
jgi:replicative DNA helicase